MQPIATVRVATGKAPVWKSPTPTQPHTNVNGEVCAELKTEAALESALRSSLFKEQTAWLLQEPGRGNDRLTHWRREKDTHYKRRRGEQLVWAELSSLTQPDTRRNLLFVSLCEHWCLHKSSWVHTHLDVSADVVNEYVWGSVCVCICVGLCVCKWETEGGKIGVKARECESEFRQSSDQKKVMIPSQTVGVLIFYFLYLCVPVCVCVCISTAEMQAGTCGWGSSPKQPEST